VLLDLIVVVTPEAPAADAVSSFASAPLRRPLDCAQECPSLALPALAELPVALLPLGAGVFIALGAGVFFLEEAAPFELEARPLEAGLASPLSPPPPENLADAESWLAPPPSVDRAAGGCEPSSAGESWLLSQRGEWRPHEREYFKQRRGLSGSCATVQNIISSCMRCRINRQSGRRG